MSSTNLQSTEKAQYTGTSSRRPKSANGGDATWPSAPARVGWVALLVISIGGVLNHLLGTVSFATGGEEQLTFAMFAGINAYATAVLLTSYRQRKVWAWLITWLQVAAFAAVLPLTGGGGIGLGYLVVAAVAAVAQLATLPSFWSQRTPRR